MHDPEDMESSPSLSKRSRTLTRPRACDLCRQKKIRCEGSETSGECAYCHKAGTQCKYTNEVVRKRTPTKNSKAYIESLEERLANMEKMLTQVRREARGKADIYNDMDMPNSMSSDSDPDDVFASPRTNSPVPSTVLPVSLPSPDDKADITCQDVKHDLTTVDLAGGMKYLGMGNDVRFYGRASAPALVHRAFDFRRRIRGDNLETYEYLLSIADVTRKSLWQMFPWETAVDTRPKKDATDYSFPEPDLLECLIDLYFKNVNLFLPLLHRPTFEKSVWEDRLHEKDDDFGGIVLLVCAIGSRFSDDSRVTMDSAGKHPYSSGWSWFIQVKPIQMTIMMRPLLYDLQKCTLSVIYMQGCSPPRASWTMLGTGIRFAQDYGVHRKHMFMSPDMGKAEHELWKRAFWCLVCLDRIFSLALGRTVAIQDEDIEADFPIVCDDEYWFDENGEELFKQPPDKPSTMAYFVSYLELFQILAFSLRTVYSFDKSRIRMGLVGKEWQNKVVNELDSSLNRWLDSVPEHLRWDPYRENETFFEQSIVLNCNYYNVQILIHRSFIPSPTEPKEFQFPSVAICANAARSLIHIAERQLQRGAVGGLHHVMMQVFTSSIVLLMGVWSTRLAGRTTNAQNVMVDIEKALQVLQRMERRWPVAGRSWDILRELASTADVPHMNSQPNKRPREPNASNHEVRFVFDPSTEDTRVIVDDKRVEPPYSAPAPPTPGPSSTQGFSDTFATPLDAGYGGLSDFGTTTNLSDEPMLGQVDPLVGGEGFWNMDGMPLWPTGLEIEDWGRYLSSVNDWTQGTG